MKVESASYDVERIGTTKEKAFTINASAEAFKILSSGLYSNKEEAIVRELACNAYDSHVAAKNTDPIEIIAPNAMNPTLVIKDYGTGLSPEDVEHIYTTYFESTKKASNDYVGALGLGSKSPFSYCSSFVVESRWNNKTYTYSMFLNEDGVPSVALMGVIETPDERNGVTITLGVKQQDINAFNLAIITQTRYFTIPPHIRADTSRYPRIEVKYSVKTDSWGIRNDDKKVSLFRAAGPQVIQGIVAYPLDLSQFPELPSDFKYLDIDLFVPIGTANVAASREDLSYDKPTKAALSKFIRNITKDIFNKIQADINKQPNLYLATQYYNNLNETRTMLQVIRNIHGDFQYTGHPGQPINSYFELSLEKANPLISTVGITRADITIYRSAYIGQGRTPQYLWSQQEADQHVADTKIKLSQGIKPIPTNTKFVTRIRFDLTSKTTIYVNDLRSSKGQRRIRYHRHDNSSYCGHSQYILELEQGATDTTAIDELIKLIGVPVNEVVYASSLPDVTLPSMKTNKKQLEDFYVWTGFKYKKSGWSKTLNRTFSTMCWDTTKLDLNQPQYYVITHYAAVCNGKKTTEDGKIFQYFDIFLDMLYKEQIIPANTQIIGVTIEQAKKLDLSKWINLFDFAKQPMLKLITEYKTSASGIIEHLRSQDYKLNEALYSLSGREIKKVNSIQDVEFRNLITIYKQATGNQNKFKPEFKYIIETLEKHFWPKDKVNVTKSTIPDFEQTIKHLEVTKYPMLSWLVKKCDWKYNTRDVDIFIEYINDRHMQYNDSTP